MDGIRFKLWYELDSSITEWKRIRIFFCRYSRPFVPIRAYLYNLITDQHITNRYIVLHSIYSVIKEDDKKAHESVQEKNCLSIYARCTRQQSETFFFVSTLLLNITLEMLLQYNKNCNENHPNEKSVRHNDGCAEQR